MIFNKDYDIDISIQFRVAENSKIKHMITFAKITANPQAHNVAKIAQRRQTNANLLSPFHIREMAKFGDRDATRLFLHTFVLFLVIANAPPTKNTFKYTIVAQRENDTRLSYARPARTRAQTPRVRKGRRRVQIEPRERRLRNFRKLNRQ